LPPHPQRRSRRRKSEKNSHRNRGWIVFLVLTTAVLQEMRRSRLGGKESLASQVNRALLAIFRPDESRHAAKERGVDDRAIFSYATLRTYRQRCLTLLNVLPPDSRPRLLRDLTTAHLERGITLLQARNVSDAHIKTLLAAVRKLVWGMRELGWTTIQPDDLVPAALNAGLIASAPRGGYSEEQIVRLRRYVAAQRQSSELLRLFDLILASGLRHDEAARLWESDLTRQDGFVRVRGTNAKGGRERIIGPHLDREGLRALHAAIAAIPPGRHELWPGGPALARRLEETIRAACKDLGYVCKGIHGLRATFASRFIDRQLAEGIPERIARLRVSRMLGHNRIDVTYRYAAKRG
jgi:integrase